MKIFLFLALLCIDFITKYLFFDRGFLSDSFFISPVCNTGISFSFMVPYMVTIFVSIFAVGIFSWLLVTKKIPWLVGIVLLVGVTGNLFDRVVYGCVRDFLWMYFFVCNMADIYLTLGALRILKKELFEKKR